MLILTAALFFCARRTALQSDSLS